MKALGIVIGILALLAFVPLVYAEEAVNETQTVEPVLIAQPANETSEEVEVEDLNESDASGFKPFMQELKVMFEFNKERKAHLELELARLRLIQAKIAAKNNNTAAMEQAIEAHNRIMERIRTRANEISNAGGNLTGLERAIQVHELRIAKLNALLENANLTAEQKAKIEARIQHVENVTWKLEQLQVKIQERQQEREQERLSQSSNESEEELEEENETEKSGCTTGTCGNKNCPVSDDSDEEDNETEPSPVTTCTSCGCGRK